MKVTKFFVIFAVLFFAVSWFSPSQARSISKVPDFSLPAVPDKKPVAFRDYKGKVVLLTFWATWCGPCVQEIPSLISLQKEFGSDNFSVIAISMDQGGDSLVGKMIKKTGINYPVVMGNAKVSQDFGGIFGIPTSFLVSRSGKVVKRYNGWVSHYVLEKDIKRVIH